ncbi:MAG: arsenate reductase (glutaredoxin) [archaeon]
MCMEIYYNPKCSTCHVALDLLEKKGVKLTIREYLKEPPTKTELKELIRKLGIRPEELIRKKEPIFTEKYKGKTLTDDQWIAAMVENPILIQRPIVIEGNKAIIGRPAERVIEIIEK